MKMKAEKPTEEVHAQQKKILQENMEVCGRLLAGIEQKFLEQSLTFEKQQELLKMANQYGEVLNYTSTVMRNRFIIPEQMAAQAAGGQQRPAIIKPLGN